MLRQFEADAAAESRKLNFTDRAVPQTSNGAEAGSGQLYYEMPVLRIMNREVSSLVDFQKTLSQLGLDSGSHAVQLAFKQTQQTLGEAMQEISQFFRDEEAAEASEKKAVPKAEQAPPAVSSAPAPSGAQGDVAMEATQNEVSREKAQEKPPMPAASAAPDAMDVDGPAPAPHDPLKPTGIFSAPSNTTPAAASIDLPDSYYTPTIVHAQMHQQKLQENAVNRRLKSDAEIEAEARAEEAKVAAVKRITVKARFPDGTAAQWDFGPNDTGAMLYKAVRSVMANETAPFKIVLPGPPTASSHIKDDATPKHNLIRAYKLSGRVLVNLVWEDNVPQDVKKARFMKPEFASIAQKVEVPDIPVVEDEPETSVRPQQAAPKPAEPSDSAGPKKMPKWLKGLGGKK